nr:PREDICTED: uncharacterized protein LOC100879785 isoform X1 [Megachile rotundata]
MYKGYFKLIYVTRFLILFIYICFVEGTCNFVCDTDGCKTFWKKQRDSDVPYCNTSIPTTVAVIKRNDISEFPAMLQINFKPTKQLCKYKITLFANASINEKQCMNYTFNDNDKEIHTKSTVCFVGHQYQESVNISVPFAFTACYSLTSFTNTFEGINLINNTFLKTDYKRTEITKPEVDCSYDIISSNVTNELVNYEVRISTPIVENIMIKPGLYIYGPNNLGNCDTDTRKKESKKLSQIFNIFESDTEYRHQYFNASFTTNGKYEAYGKFQAEVVAANVDRCFKIYYSDVRCENDILWKPPVAQCIWFHRCRNITNSEYFKFQLNIDPSRRPSFVLPIVVITFIIMCGVICLIYIIYYKYRTTDTHNDNINISSNVDIVLLYPKGSKSFMAFMTDLRGMLHNVCRCVHDWYDVLEWNNVASVGASEWFSEKLRKNYYVMWIDTPTTRSLIAQRFKAKSSEQGNFDKYNIVKIGDFRDVAFPTVFNLAKRDVEESLDHEIRHFIVQLKGFDNFEDKTDPFVALSSRKRYFLPQDLSSLCSDLSTLETEEEELAGQYTCNIKSNFNVFTSRFK